jgi:hypothetical protein
LFGQPIRELLAFPFQRFGLETSLPVSEALKRLIEAVEPRRMWRISRPQHDFEGVVSLTAFKISRIILYRNSFLPIIFGTIQARPQGGTRVEVMMRMHWFVIAFMLVWEAVPLVILTAVLLGLHLGGGALARPRAAGPGLYGMLIGMLIFGYGMCSIAFNIEARRARELLMNILDTEPGSGSLREKSYVSLLQRPGKR